MAPEQPPPWAFLRSLRTLFDLLDDRRRGFVPLWEIESRWLRPRGEARDVWLPLGVLEGLRRAAPASGLLTFERFVLGLRSSLLSPEKVCGGTPHPRSREDTETGDGRGAPADGERAGEKDARSQIHWNGGLEGLEMVESMRDWDHQHIHALQERQKQLGSRRSRSGLFTEGTQSHLLPKLQELYRGLKELMHLLEKEMMNSHEQITVDVIQEIRKGEQWMGHFG